MKNVLCFGDSNTHGSNPNGGARWDRSQRWTGRLQTLLGPDYYIIEEGLGGRTAVFDDPMMAGRSGLQATAPILRSHFPLDLVIVMLGTNDTKCYYSCSAGAIAKGVGYVIKEIRKTAFIDNQKMPEILLVAPIKMGKIILTGSNCQYDERSYESSQHFGEEMKKIAETEKVHFFDASTVAGPGPDGLHMDAKDHKSFAEAIEKEIKKILG